MIVVTKLRGDHMVVNAEMIKFIESTPDTMITLVNGEHLIVRESVEEVVLRAVAYGRSIRAFSH
ncbi:MAG: flagellar FlbD family protein [Planctomycetia bacterium]|jgi:flagellar protein FlbD|nr:flagellar FlbD family protein [Planctomycetia bacterium]MCC7314916.1 flagellar FlbD family protein [Planctomycetota bacterium]OQY96729.1 MAG: flagellar protein [Planctomycetes bacterium UTPLA1]